jgi:hypothetical protein
LFLQKAISNIRLIVVRINHFVKDKIEVVAVYVAILAIDRKIHQTRKGKATIRITIHHTN